MHVAIRDGTLFAAEFRSLLEGLKVLSLNSVELTFDRKARVASLNAPKGLPTVAPTQEYRHLLERAGVRVCALLLANDFSLPDLDGEVAWLVSGAAAAKALGAPAIRVDAYLRNATDWSPEKRIARFAECMKKVLASSEAQGMDFGIENHGPLGNDPTFLDAVLAAVGDSRLGLTLDTGNFYWSGKPLDEVHRVLEHFATRTKHTHLKNIQYPAAARNQPREMGWRYAEFCCALPDGDIDLVRVAKTLRDAGYDRSLCIENESLGRYGASERQQILRRDAEHLRKILGE